MARCAGYSDVRACCLFYSAVREGGGIPCVRHLPCAATGGGLALPAWYAPPMAAASSLPVNMQRLPEYEQYTWGSSPKTSMAGANRDT